VNSDTAAVEREDYTVGQITNGDVEGGGGLQLSLTLTVCFSAQTEECPHLQEGGDSWTC